MGLKTKNLKMKGDWEEVVNNARATVGKEELGKEPSEEFKNSILIAEHSPIRAISFRWKWPDIKSWIATHWTRHKWECWVRTRRSDKTRIDRNKLPQDVLVDFVGEANVQHLIDTMRKRLCRKASQETRDYAKDLKFMISTQDLEISNVLVPNCVYRCGCPEMGGCNFWSNLCDYYRKWHSVELEKLSIQERYKYYNDYFHQVLFPQYRDKIEKKRKEE